MISGTLRSVSRSSLQMIMAPILCYLLSRGKKLWSLIEAISLQDGTRRKVARCQGILQEAVFKDKSMRKSRLNQASTCPLFRKRPSQAELVASKIHSILVIRNLISASGITLLPFWMMTLSRPTVAGSQKRDRSRAWLTKCSFKIVRWNWQVNSSRVNLMLSQMKSLAQRTIKEAKTSLKSFTKQTWASRRRCTPCRLWSAMISTYRHRRIWLRNSIWLKRCLCALKSQLKGRVCLWLWNLSTNVLAMLTLRSRLSTRSQTITTT